jgi:hypothetical protein
MLNLFDIAESNSPRWEKAFRELADQQAKVAQFAEWVRQAGRISMNRSWSTLTRLTQGDTLKNHYEIAQEMANRNGGDPEDFLKASLKGFYQRRVAFDRAFENGELFRYGALNGGCVGTEKFGPVCLIFSIATQESLANFACLLPGDSLFLCTDAAEKLNEERVRNLVGPFRQRAEYACVHRTTAISRAEKSSWKRVLLNAGDEQNGCIEVIFLGSINLKSLDAVRLSKTSYEAAWNAVFSAHAPDAAISKKATVTDFTSLLKAVANKELRLEIIP